MTEIYVHCPTCNEKDNGVTRAKSVKIMGGELEYELTCGHKVVESFRLTAILSQKLA